MINVLVVDDSALARKLFGRVFAEQPDFHVTFARNGKEALASIAEFVPDVVTLDVHMPEMDGLEANQAIRANPDHYYQQLPIIALTASMLHDQMEEIGQAGMNDYILKPFDPKNLYDKISKYSKE